MHPTSNKRSQNNYFFPSPFASALGAAGVAGPFGTAGEPTTTGVADAVVVEAGTLGTEPAAELGAFAFDKSAKAKSPLN